MPKGDGPYKMVQMVGDNGYKVELSGDMNISPTFNVGGFTPYIEVEDEGIEDLRANSLWGREVDAEQATQSNLLNHMKTLVRIWPMMTYKHKIQGFGLSKSLWTWNLWKGQKSSLGEVIRYLGVIQKEPR